MSLTTGLTSADAGVAWRRKSVLNGKAELVLSATHTFCARARGNDTAYSLVCQVVQNGLHAVHQVARAWWCKGCIAKLVAVVAAGNVFR